MNAPIRRSAAVLALVLAVSLSVGVGADPPPMSVPQSRSCKETCGGRPPHNRCDAPDSDGLAQPTKQCGW